MSRFADCDPQALIIVQRYTLGRLAPSIELDALDALYDAHPMTTAREAIQAIERLWT